MSCLGDPEQLPDHGPLIGGVGWRIIRAVLVVILVSVIAYCLTL